MTSSTKPELTLEGALSLISELQSVITELRTEIIELRAENQELKELLNSNSNNSSSPPSRDRKKPNRNRAKSVKKRGGQPKHQGTTRRRMEANEVIKCELPYIHCKCGGKLTVSEEIKIHQVVELPEIPSVIVRNYERQQARCSCCGIRITAALPKGVPRGVCGTRLSSVMSVLTTEYRLSKRQVKKLLKQFWNIDLSLGTISQQESVTSEAIADNYADICAKTDCAAVKYVDETGYKLQEGQKGQVWVVATDQAVRFHIDKSRGSKVAKKLIGETSPCITVTDRYSSYQWLEPEKRQVCLAHILRDFTKISERTGSAGAIGKRLLSTLQNVFHHWHLRDDDPDFLPKIMKLKERLRTLLYHATNCSHLTTQRTACKIMGVFDSLWTFIEVKGVEPTNNYAERSLRPIVIHRKLSFGVESIRGAEFIERMFSAVQTITKTSVNILNFLSSLIDDFHSNNNRSYRAILARR